MNDKIVKNKEIEKIIEAVTTSDTKLIFGEQIEKDGKTVIPVGRVQTSFGFGYGVSEDSDSKDAEPGYGGGGGAGVKVNPVGYIEISDEGSKFVKIPEPELSLKSVAVGAAIGAGLYSYISTKDKRSRKNHSCCSKYLDRKRKKRNPLEILKSCFK